MGVNRNRKNLIDRQVVSQRAVWVSHPPSKIERGAQRSNLLLLLSLIYGTCGLNTHGVPDPSMSFHKAATYSDPCHLMPLINKWHATYSYSAVVDHCLVVFTVQRASTLCGQWFGNLSLDFVFVCKCFFIFHWSRFPCLTCNRAKKNVVVALPSIHATSTWNLCGGISGDFDPKVKLSLR